MSDTTLCPMDIQAERAVLGACLANNEAMAAVCGIIGPEAFLQEDHRIIFGTMADMRRTGKPTDVVTVRSELTQRNLWEDVGGAPYFAQLLESVPLLANAGEYAKVVAARHRERQALALAKELQEGLSTPRTDAVAEARIADIAAKLAALREPSGITSDKAGDFCAAHPEPEPELIGGVLRCGGVAGIVSGSKCKKSHFLLHLLLSIANNRAWLGHPVRQGRVLLIDLETQRGDLARRIRAVASAMAAPTDNLEVLPLRGDVSDIHGLARRIITRTPKGQYAAIGIDPVYKLTPSGADENSAADVGRMMARLDEIATATGAAVFVVHHAPKGDTSARTTLDFGAGSGAFARAVDAMIAIRPHEEDDHAVLEIVCRCFREPPHVGLAWNWPCWQLDPELDVTRLRAGRGSAGAVSVITPDELVRRFITPTTTWHGTLMSRMAGSGVTQRAAKQALSVAVDEGKIKVVRSKKDGRKKGYKLPTPEAL